MNNVPTPLMQIINHPWPSETLNYVNHKVINQYIEDAARASHLEKHTIFSTKVERLSKEDEEWTVVARTMTRNKNNKLNFITHQYVRSKSELDPPN